MNSWVRIRACMIPGMLTAEDQLRNPRPGSRVEAAHNFGVDLTLLIEGLRKSPEERVRDLQCAIKGLRVDSRQSTPGDD